MLNIATTTLQIKTTGVNMSDVQTLYITIKQGDSIFAKSNSDIEVDGDVISVALTKEETEKLKSGGGTRVTITAVDSEGVSADVKVVWVKFGSQSNHDTDSSGGSAGGGDGSSGSSPSMFGFEIREDGWLWLVTDNPLMADKFYINDDGILIYRLE
ncbi:MAG: hypothetical protein NC489_38390 [Ruminococcus flavefaciens]|nr:hypothetical protein [Ruminococcus flavefaciens]